MKQAQWRRGWHQAQAELVALLACILGNQWAAAFYRKARRVHGRDSTADAET